MYKVLIPIVAVAIFGLIGFIGVSAKEEIAKKADNKTILVIVEQIKKERQEDREEQKGVQQRQQTINEYNQKRDKELMESIQMMLIKMVEKQ